MKIKMYRFAVLALSFLINEQTVFAASIDQRQNGDFNVQIDLKNLKIVGLMKGKEEYVDYDYAYDYSEMTIKPSSGTTQKPLNVTASPASDINNITAATTVFAELDQTTASIQTSTVSSIETTDTTHKIATDELSTTNATTPSFTETTGTNSLCKKGFSQNSKGNCELKLQNPSNALLKMIKQKSKLNSSTTVRRS